MATKHHIHKLPEDPIKLSMLHIVNTKEESQRIFKSPEQDNSMRTLDSD